MTKEEWRSGEYRNLPEFKTEDGYYNAVSEFVKEYGEPTKEDMIVARSGDLKEFKKKKIGASWNPSINNTRCIAKFYGADTIYVMFVPKGTMAVHFEQGEGEGMTALEEEYVFDIKGLGLLKKSAWGDKKHHLGILASHSGSWDLSSDFETDLDIDNWNLYRKDWIVEVRREVVNTFFN